MKAAYIWTREHSLQRLRAIENVAWTWQSLFGEAGRRGHYAGIQWVEERAQDRRGVEAFQGVVDDRPVTIHLNVVSARAWYARELYIRALARTRARYPDFDAHRFVDGDRVGERRIEFLNERHALSVGHLHTSLWWTAKEDNPVVHEACLMEPCGEWGSPVAAARRSETAPHQGHLRVTLVLDVKNTRDADPAGVIADLKAGRSPGIPPEPIRCSYDDISNGFVELSGPELVVLNWEDALPVETAADAALWMAAGELDADGIERALANGANSNSLRHDQDSLLSWVIEAWKDHDFRCHASDRELALNGWIRPSSEVSHEQVVAMLRRLLDAGAHPDLHAPDQVPAIVTAALAPDPAIAALLLDYGADPTINPYWDEGPGGCGGWPAAWDFAHTDGFVAYEDAGAREVYYELIRRGSSPAFSQSTEDDDRRDALLPPKQRAWQPGPFDPL